MKKHLFYKFFCNNHIMGSIFFPLHGAEYFLSAARGQNFVFPLHGANKISFRCAGRE